MLDMISVDWLLNGAVENIIQHESDLKPKHTNISETVNAGAEMGDDDVYEFEASSKSVKANV